MLICLFIILDAEVNNYIKTVNILHTYETIPLPYDIMLMGIPLIKEAFTDLDWNSMNCYTLSKIEEVSYILVRFVLYYD